MDSTTEKNGTFGGYAQLTCARCGQTWTPRMDRPPVRCPRCSSVAWQRPIRRSGAAPR